MDIPKPLDTQQKSKQRLHSEPNHSIFQKYYHQLTFQGQFLKHMLSGELKMKKNNTNGCGPGFVSRIPGLGESSYFKDSCNIHDQDYSNGISRPDADKRFLNNMLIQSKNNLFRKAQSYIFYGLVRVFGWMFHD